MQDKELENIWKAYDQKLDKVLTLNKEILSGITRNKLNTTISSMQGPKRIMLLIGLPYTFLLYFITFIAYKAGGLFVTIGFGSIALIMTAIIIGYFYHLYLIKAISHALEITEVQKKMAELKISSFNIVRLAIFQLPFWSICWISLDALKESPLVYGGVNLIVFGLLTYFAFWLYKRLSIDRSDSKVSRFFLSGIEWDPIIKSSEILEQLQEYKKA